MTNYPGRQRPGRLRHRRLAHRAAGQRRRGHALHVVDLLQRRLVHADGHLRGRHRPRRGPGARAEPRWPSPQPRLPEEVQRQGVTAKKQSTNIILVVAAELARRPLRQPVPVQLRHAAGPRRAEPRSTASATSTVFGSSNYGMRIWLDPEKLKARNLTTEDVLAAIREQNVQVAAGQVGQPPTPPGPELPVHRHHAGPAQRPRAVREHHRQDGRAKAGRVRG